MVTGESTSPSRRHRRSSESRAKSGKSSSVPLVSSDNKSCPRLEPSTTSIHKKSCKSPAATISAHSEHHKSPGRRIKRESSRRLSRTERHHKDDPRSATKRNSRKKAVEDPAERTCKSEPFQLAPNRNNKVHEKHARRSTVTVHHTEQRSKRKSTKKHRDSSREAAAAATRIQSEEEEEYPTPFHGMSRLLERLDDDMACVPPSNLRQVSADQFEFDGNASAFDLKQARSKKPLLLGLFVDKL